MSAFGIVDSNGVTSSAAHVHAATGPKAESSGVAVGRPPLIEEYVVASLGRVVCAVRLYIVYLASMAQHLNSSLLPVTCGSSGGSSCAHASA